MINLIIESADSLLADGYEPVAIVVSFKTAEKVVNELINGFNTHSLQPYVDANISPFQLGGYPVYISSMSLNLMIDWFVAVANA